MKHGLLALMTFLSVNLAQASVGDKDLLQCHSDVPGAPSYTLAVKYSYTEGEDNQYILTKRHNNPTVPAVSRTLREAYVLDHGSVLALTADYGRTGYVHIYHHGDTSVIDVNIFGESELNTHGPVTNYTCVKY